MNTTRLLLLLILVTAPLNRLPAQGAALDDLRAKYAEQIGIVQQSVGGTFSAEMLKLLPRLREEGKTAEMEAVQSVADALKQGIRIPPKSVTDPAAQSVIDLYHKELSTQLIDVKTKYIDFLQVEVVRLRNSGDFGAAIEMKRERDGVEEQINSGNVIPEGDFAPPGAREFTLLAGDALPVGEVELAERWEALVRWFGSGSGASWKLESVPKGTYQVTISHSGLEEGEVTIEQGTSTVSCLVPGTGSWDEYESLEAGNISVTDPQSPLIIKVKDDRGSPFGIFNLKSVTLTRVPAES